MFWKKRRQEGRRKKSPEEIRRLKELGLFDVGASYLKIGGFDRRPKREFWDDVKDDAQRE